MVVLREMQKEEYPIYCQYFIADYSREIAQNYGHSIEWGVELAKKDLQRCFPNGLEGSEHSLLCIDADIDGQLKHVGYLWHSINAGDKSTYISDFFVLDEFRGLGYGTFAIAAFEKQLKEAGINQIKLRVACQNERALKLYQEVGFAITGFNMSKNIGE
ncbi:GNAT family N-acetyltransferase [Vreelandella sp. GE22]